MKKSIVISVVLLLSLAGAIYVKKERTQRTKPHSIGDESRVTLEEFDVYRYQIQKLESRFSARSARLYEPNRILVEGNPVGIRYKTDEKGESKEILRTHTATILFQADNFGKMLQSPPVDKALLTEGVEAGFMDMMLLTEKADYLFKTDTLQSELETTIEGPNKKMKSANGFSYDLKKQQLIMQGKITGVFVPPAQK